LYAIIFVCIYDALEGFTLSGQTKGKSDACPISQSYLSRSNQFFFKYLPYWKDLQTCHIIDLMHVTKNIFDSIIGTFLDVPTKSKDGQKSCTDLVQFELRPELHRISRHNGKYFLP
jgi:hypothetical protein